MLWKENIRVNIVAVSDQVVHCYCSMQTTVYASLNATKHKFLWDYIASLKPLVSIPWILEGDFNVIIFNYERKGGAKVRLGGNMLFKDFIFYQSLIDLGFKGPSYIWSKGSLF